MPDPVTETPAPVQADEPIPAAETAPETPVGKDGTPFDPERLQRALDAAREDARRARADNAALQAAAQELATLKQAQETEAERLKRERDEAVANDAASKEALRRGHLLAALAKPEHALVDAEAAATLLTGVEYGEDGRPTNLDTLLPGFIEAKPFLKATPTTPAPPTVPNVNGGAGTGGAAPPQLTASEVRMAEQSGMTPEEYVKYRDADNYDDLKAAGLIT